MYGCRSERTFQFKRSCTMGFMSRKVLPVCGTFCVCCPALRSRSRQPVKRYKKLVADIFPKNQAELPNDRKIAKLCDYAAKNPLRIPKIAISLEQKGYKELRSEKFGSVRVIMSAFIKLFSSCKGQMPLFAVSALNMIKILLDQTRHDEMRILGCSALFEFAYSQIDGTYIHHIDGLLSSIFGLAEETGEEIKRRQLRSAGLRALSAVIWFMGAHSHMPSAYDHVVSVIMDNYEHPSVTTENDMGKGEKYQYWVKEVVKAEGRASITDAFTKLSFRKEAFPALELSNPNSFTEIPSVWAKTCLEKIALLAKEATTTRRYLEPMFHYFDSGKHWSPEQGLALSVLQLMLHFMEKSGNDCFLLAVLVRHLDHRNVYQKPQMKADIVKIIASLSQQSNSEGTVVEIGVLSDLLRHLRQSLQAASGEAFGHVERDLNKDFQLAIHRCLLELVKKVGDANLIFEMMAVTLEKVSADVNVARNTMDSLLILARILATLPEQLQTQQSFPEALLHQVSLAMVHPDVYTRIGAHRIFETVLAQMPTGYLGDSTSFTSDVAPDILRTNSLNSPVFTSAAVLLEILRNEHTSSNGSLMPVDVPAGSGKGKRDILENSESGLSREMQPKLDRTKTLDNSDQEMTAARLTGDQASLLLSTLWNGANMDDNLPANYEAISMTFSLTLLFSAAKNSSHNIFVKSFQLALSLRTLALMDTHATLSPARQRSLFILSTAMLNVASKVYNVPGIISHTKAPLARGLVDPFLELANDISLKTTARMESSQYGTPTDNASAFETLARLRLEKDISNESLVSIILSNSSCSFEMELSSFRAELLRMFSPDDGFALGLDLQLNPNRPWAAVLFNKTISFDEVVEIKDDLISDTSCADLPQFFSKTPIHTPSANVIGVSQLLESALETAGQVAGVSVAATPLPYSAVATRCEEFGTTARKNMSIWMNTDNKALSLTYCEQIQPEIPLLQDTGIGSLDTVTFPPPARTPFLLPSAKEPWQTLQLPPVSHYDNFLRAAGC